MQVTTLDLSETPLEQLKILVEKIYLPILSNPANQKGLPKLVANEVTQHLHKHISDSRQSRNRPFGKSCVNIVSVMIGHTKGQTVLPLPVLNENDSSLRTTKQKIHILEDSVVTWSRQIKKVLMADPDALLKVHPLTRHNEKIRLGLAGWSFFPWPVDRS